MATFKDIAELAGVSYGTVSNVFNGRGNVSSEKIRRVHQAAAQLGYTPNQNAQQLRRTVSNVLSVVLPNLDDRQYSDFYTSFRVYAESMGYQTTVYLSDNSERREELLATEIRSTHPAGVAVISVLSGAQDPYMQIGFSPAEVVFVEQRPFVGYDYIGFDYRRIGREMGRKAAIYDFAALITGDSDSYVTREFKSGFLRESRSCHVVHYEKRPVDSASLALDVLSSDPAPQAVFSSLYHCAATIRSVHQNFFTGGAPDIYTLSPLFTIPENDFEKYELNYRLLGHTAAQQLIRRVTNRDSFVPEDRILPAGGMRTWIPAPVPEEGELTVMTLDSPTAAIVKNMARMYTKYTGIPVRVSVFPYDGIHMLLSTMDESTPFDVIRLDATWMSWFAKKIFEPLENLDPQVNTLAEQFLPNTLETYGRFSHNIYALPETPSTQMLFYRRDLFENTAVRRLYQESVHEPLLPPRSFDEFNRIAAFFTRRLNPQSPVRFGATLTLGNTGTAATEFLCRYFALTRDLFDENGRILLSSQAGITALRQLVQSAPCVSSNYTFWWRDTARAFAAGDTAMTILFSNYASEMLEKHSQVFGKIGYAMVPGGNPMCGGGSIGVCRFSKKKALAYHFIHWMCSETVATAMTMLGSVSPCRATYDNYQVMDTYPWLSMAGKCFRSSNMRRSPSDGSTPFNERRFLEILGTQVMNALNGSCSVEEALSTVERQYNASF